MKNKVIGIMGAMPEEIDGVVALLSNCAAITKGKRTYFSGQINGIETVVVFSRWGKVAASTTATTLIHEFKITELLFTSTISGSPPKTVAINTIPKKNSIKKMNRPTMVAKTFPRNLIIVFF